MDVKQLKQLTQIFEQQRLEVLSSISRLEQEARAQVEDGPQDLGDLSVSTLSKEFLFQQLTASRNRLGKLETALQRVRKGDFGQCLNCGSDIGMKRLKAVPWAEYCRDCQEALELGQPTPLRNTAD
ncbi:MAG: TraR/DksA family transcriptional regulator [Acidobacteria bacterium]|nr:TraR/DksA family transcriptional regulator [Acidobacteriota bacterium]